MPEEAARRFASSAQTLVPLGFPQPEATRWVPFDPVEIVDSVEGPDNAILDPAELPVIHDVPPLSTTPCGKFPLVLSTVLRPASFLDPGWRHHSN